MKMGVIHNDGKTNDNVGKHFISSWSLSRMFVNNEFF